MQWLERFEHHLRDALDHHESRWGKVMGYVLMFLIVTSTITFVLETTSLDAKYGQFFRDFDVFVISFFTLEYIFRILVARDRWKFITSPLGIIDLLVILPFYLSFTNLTFLRGFRILRILQVLKIVRYSEVMLSFFRSFKHYKEEFRIFGITFGMVLVLSSCGLYYLEQGINPKFASIPDALWWAVVTMSTLGYGDIVPVTMAGKVLASIIVIMGLCTIAIMTAIITKIFIDHFFGKHLHHCEFCRYPHHDHDAKFCKNCGGQLDTEALGKAEWMGRR